MVQEIVFKSFVTKCPMDTRRVRLLSRKQCENNQPVPFTTCREKNLSVYLNLLTVREKFLKSKKYQAWNYYSDKDVVEEQANKRTSVDLESIETPPGHVTSVSVTKPERKKSARKSAKSAKSAKKVAFSVTARSKDENEEKFPYIEPTSRASSQARANTKLSDVMFSDRKSSPRKSVASTASCSTRNGELFHIMFRKDSSRQSQMRYDPRSELHSDYYSIKKVPLVPRYKPKSPKQVSLPDSKQSFQAILLGSQKRMVKKYDKGNIKVPYYSWDKFNRVSNMRGYTSVPIY